MAKHTFQKAVIQYWQNLHRPKGIRRYEFPCYETASEICICVAVLHIAEVVRFAFHLNAISAFSDGCNSSMWTLSNEYLKCSAEKSHFRVQWLFQSRSSGQLWNIRPCKACLFNQFPYFQLLTLLLCMFFFAQNVLNQFWSIKIENN